MADFDRVLILETAGKVGQAALASNDQIVAEGKLGAERRRASDLAAVVDQLMRDAEWEPSTLTAVVVGLGPGSYTGLRVGLASAKAMAYAIGCKFFGVETYAAIALRSLGSISVIGDALKGKLFHRNYDHTGSQLAATGPLEIVSGNDWAAQLVPETLVAGPAAGLWVGRIPSDVAVVNDQLRDPRPIDILIVAKTCPWAVTTEMWTAEPLYLRGSSAEENVLLRT